MNDTPANTTAKQPGEQDKRNEADASEADKQTVANVRKNETEKEKEKPEFRPPS